MGNGDLRLAWRVAAAGARLRLFAGLAVRARRAFGRGSSPGFGSSWPGDRGRRFLLGIEQRFELALAMHGGEPHRTSYSLPSRRYVSGTRQPLGIGAEHVLEGVGRADLAAAEAHDLVAVAQAAAVGVAVFEDVVDDDAAVGIGRHGCAERGVIDDPAALQLAEEVLDLVDRDGVADADVDAAALFERAAAVDADQLAVGVEQRPAGVAGVDRGVGLQAVGVFEQRAGRILIAMHAGDDAVGDRRLEVVGQQERIADDVDPIADAARVAVAQLGGGKLVFAEELDQGDVAARIEADEHGVDEAAVGQAALSWPAPVGAATWKFVRA